MRLGKKLRASWRGAAPFTDACVDVVDKLLQRLAIACPRCAALLGDGRAADILPFVAAVVLDATEVGPSDVAHELFSHRQHWSADELGVEAVYVCRAVGVLQSPQPGTSFRPMRQPLLRAARAARGTWVEQ